MRIKFMLCAQGVIRDAETNNISVFNIFDEFTPFGLPALITEIMVLVVLEREDDDPSNIDCSLRATFTGEQILNQNLPVDFQGKRRTRAIVRIGGLPVPGPGPLIMEFTCGDLVHQYDIMINPPPARVEPH